ncbi:MAG: C39 family peptidase [Candidatus Eisenbacteria bacterium]
MDISLQFEITPQPNDTTCGPCCLHAVYRYFEKHVPEAQILREVPMLEEGGTLAVQLGIHALRSGFHATLSTLNIQVFDPTWFDPEPVVDLPTKLLAQRTAKRRKKLRVATDAYLEFLELGGKIRFAAATPDMIRNTLKRELPILTGLSSTYLYRSARERPDDQEEDDIRGEPVGHFVVLCGYDSETRAVRVADPLASNPMGSGHIYSVAIDRVIGAILLGVLTYDANLLVLEPDR